MLKALTLGETHGYGIGARIQQLADDMLRVEEGTLYPALYRIEQRLDRQRMGHVRKQSPGALLPLTRAGRKQLGIEAAVDHLTSPSPSHAGHHRLMREGDTI